MNDELHALGNSEANLEQVPIGRSTDQQDQIVDLNTRVGLR